MRKKQKRVGLLVIASVAVVAVGTTSMVACAAISQVKPIVDEKNSSVVECLASQGGQMEPLICEAVPLSADFQKKVQEFCGDSCVPYEIALAVIYQESRFDENAVNGSCVGLMQVNRINGQWLFDEIGITDLEDPEQNLHAGIWMLGELFQKYGEWNMALTAYNHGEAGAKKKFFDNGKISCDYSEEVLRNSEEWKAVLEESHGQHYHS